MNLFKLLGLIIGNNLKDAEAWLERNAKEARRKVELTVRLLCVAIGIPVVMLFTGILLANQCGDAPAGHFGRGLIVCAGLLSSALMLLFWIRAIVIVNIVVFAAKGANLVTDKIKPIDRDEAEKFLRWLRHVTTWVTAVWLYLMIFPVWHDLKITAVTVTCLLFFSGVMSSEWFQPVRPYARYAAMIIALGVFGFCTFWAVSPEFVDSITVKRERLEKLSQERQAAAKQEADLDQAVLQKLNARQQQLRRRAFELCAGHFCGDEEMNEYRQNEARIKDVQDGTYWQKQLRTEAAVPPAASAPAAVLSGPSGDASQADLPPPAAARQAVRSKGALPRVKPALTIEGSEDVFDELDRKYPGL